MISFLDVALSYMTSQQSQWKGAINSLALVTYSDSVMVTVPSGGAIISSLGKAITAPQLSSSSDRNVSGALNAADSLVSFECFLCHFHQLQQEIFA